jgi:hypothetical protein
MTGLNLVVSDHFFRGLGRKTNNLFYERFTALLAKHQGYDLYHFSAFPNRTEITNNEAASVQA